MFDFLCLPMRKFCYNDRNKTLNSMKTLKLKLLQVRLKWKKIQKFYLYMDYLKFPYHPLNLNKSKKTSVRYLSLPIFDLWQTSQTNYCHNKVHAEFGVKELSKGENQLDKQQVKCNRDDSSKQSWLIQHFLFFQKEPKECLGQLLLQVKMSERAWHTVML